MSMSLALLLFCLQYNYVENFPTTANASFWALSYSGDGVAEGRRCGCSVCPNMPCGLGRSGPAPGPLRTDPRQPNNGAVGASLEGCAGSSGNCMTVNGQSCCLGTFSYERVDRTAPVCTSACDLNFWSSISAAAPLTALWTNVTVRLPQAR